MLLIVSPASTYSAGASPRSVGIMNEICGNEADDLDKMNRPSRALPQLVRSQRNVTAEEAVTNILYNTPPPSTEPFKRYVFSKLTMLDMTDW